MYYIIPDVMMNDMYTTQIRNLQVVLYILKSRITGLTKGPYSAAL